MQAEAEAFFSRGWCAFDPDPDITRWVTAAAPVAMRLAEDPAHRADWLRCGGTWFAGVNAFPNDAAGAVADAGVPPLSGTPLNFVAEVLGFPDVALDAAQISVCYPGYPKPWDGESEAAFRFRRDRDAAHVDGLTRSPPARRRWLGETHGFVLGVPLGETAPEAAPLVVWEGSHEIMRNAFRERLAGVAPEAWAAQDITDAYAAARRVCFEDCPRVPIHVAPGGSYLVHRLALHGVAPWSGNEMRPRAIAYFRPDPFPGAPPDWWLDQP